MPATCSSFRLFSCARCHKQVLICSKCDYGNIYCSKSCALERRRESNRQASRRYQSRPPGARNHARRQGAYRARQKKVTHQGSVTRGDRAKRLRMRRRACSWRSRSRHRGVEKLNPTVVRCHFCGCEGSSWYRLGFLGRKGVP